MDKDIAVQDNILGIDHSILSKLETYEDYLSFYIQLEEASSAFSWLKADTLYQMVRKFGDGSLDQLAKDVSHPRSTVINYVRTARAFPTTARDAGVSFSAHFQASFADSYDEKTKEFDGETRFEWIKKASEERLSTRRLAEQIQREKQRVLLDVPIIPCHYCGGTQDLVFPYVFFSPGSKRKADKLELHGECYLSILNNIHGYKKQD